LEHYADAVYKYWQPRGEVKKEWLYEGLGNGLLSIWAGRLDGKRLVTKTPSVRNVGSFFKFFPEAYLLEPNRFRSGRAIWTMLNVVFDIWWWLTRAPRAASRRLPEYIHLALPQWTAGSRGSRKAWGRTPPGAA
jgi:hypothetical protein